MISFIASHFEDINKEKLVKLSIDLLEGIIQTESLKIKDEDSLFSFIFSLFEKDQSYSVLFEHILFPNLSEKSLELFISTFSINFFKSKNMEFNMFTTFSIKLKIFISKSRSKIY